jgi:hypothetical protein
MMRGVFTSSSLLVLNFVSSYYSFKYVAQNSFECLCIILISILSRFRSGGNGNSNARVLNTILKKNTVIEEVNLSFTGLDDDGIEEVRT